MAIWLLTFGFFFVAKASGLEEFSSPQVVREGQVEKLYDQGLVRKDEQIVDYWRNFDGNLIRIKKLEIGSGESKKIYDVIIVIQREGDLRTQGEINAAWSSAHMGFVPNMFRWVRDFVHREYGETDPEIVTAMKKERDFYNGVSSMVIITEENDLSKIQGVLRVVRRGQLKENEQLDVEHRFGDLDKALPDQAVSPEARNANGKKEIVGDWAEIKTFLNSRNSKTDFTPYLLSTLDQYRLYEYGNRYHSTNGEELPWAATRLVLETSAPKPGDVRSMLRSRAFSRYGFDVAPLPPKEDLIVMTSTVEQFTQKMRALGKVQSAEVQEYLKKPPMAGWNYVPVVTPDLKTFYAKNRSAIDGSRTRNIPPFLLAGRRDVPFYRTPSVRIPELEEFSRIQILPAHPFDHFRRIGEDVFANTTERLQGSVPLGFLGRNGIFGREAIETYFATRKLLSEMPVAGREALIASTQRQYDTARDLGFADLRQEIDVPLASPFERLANLLKNPEQNFSDLWAALKLALDHRREDPRLDFELLAFIDESVHLYGKISEELARAKVLKGGGVDVLPQQTLTWELMRQSGLEPLRWLGEMTADVLESLTTNPPRDRTLQQSLSSLAPAEDLDKRLAEFKRSPHSNFVDALGLKEKGLEEERINSSSLKFVAKEEVRNWSAIPKELRRALREVWDLEDLKIFDEEKAIFSETTGKKFPVNSRFYWGWVGEQRALGVYYLDPYAESGVGLTVIYPDLPAPRDGQQPLTKERFRKVEIFFNGVHFRPRTYPIHREIYAGGNISEVQLRNRLRLAVNDNHLLNPWFRSEGEEIVLTPPQQEMVKFLNRSDLKRGALIQAPAGIGKTEAIVTFHRGLPKPPRILWLVSSADLPEQARARFELRGLKGRNREIWNGTSRVAAEQVKSGKIDELFVSIDSITSEKNREMLTQWIESNSQEPVLVVVDESQSLGAQTYNDVYEWLWRKHHDQIFGRVGLTATPFHYQQGDVSRWFGHNVHYSLLDPEKEVDSETGLPKITFYEQVVRAAEGGYVPIPLFYSQADPLFENLSKERKYSRAQLLALDEVQAQFRPALILAFHPPGKDQNEEGVARMRQFAEWTRTPALWAASSSKEREAVFRRFRKNPEGLLNLTNLGSEGLDLPGVSVVDLIFGTDSTRLGLQRMGRALRLQPGIPVARIIDRTGQNFATVVRDTEEVYKLRKPDQRADQSIRILLEQSEAGSLNFSDLQNQRHLMEALAVDPNLVGAEPAAFDFLFKRQEGNLRTALRKSATHFQIDFAKARELGLELTEPLEEELLSHYFSRHESSFTKAGLIKALGRVEDQVQGLVLDEHGQPLSTRGDSYLYRAWSYAFKTHWLDEQRFAIDFKIAQGAGLRLDEPRKGETRKAYLKRHQSDFESAGLLRPYAEIKDKLFGLIREIGKAPTRDASIHSLRALWKAAFGELIKTERFKVSRKRAEELGLELGLPLPNEPLSAYLRRHESAFESVGLCKSPSEITDKIFGLFLDLEGRPLSLLSQSDWLPGAWVNAFGHHWRSMPLFSINSERERELELQLSDPQVNEGLYPYLRRHEAQFKKIRVMGPPSEIGERLDGLFIDRDANPMTMKSGSFFARAWSHAFARNWSNNPKFKLNPAKVAELGLLQAEPGEGVQTYLKRNKERIEKAGLMLAWPKARPSIEGLFLGLDGKPLELKNHMIVYQSWHQAFRQDYDLEPKFIVDRKLARKLGLKFDKVRDGEELGTFLARNAEALREAELLLPYGQVEDRIDGLFEKPDGSRFDIQSVWYQRLSIYWAQSPKFELDLSLARRRGIALLPMNPGEKLGDYLKRNSAAFEKAGLIGTLGAVWEKIDGIFKDTDGTPFQFNKGKSRLYDAWKHAFTEKWETKAKFQINFRKAKDNGLELTEPMPGEQLGVYLLRHRKQLEKAELLAPASAIKDRIDGVFLDSEGEPLEISSGSSLYMAWKNNLSEFWRSETKFSFDKKLARKLSIKLAPFQPSERLGTYLARHQEALREAGFLLPLGQVKDRIKGLFLDSKGEPLGTEDSGSLSTAWQSQLGHNWKGTPIGRARPNSSLRALVNACKTKGTAK